MIMKAALKSWLAARNGSVSGFNTVTSSPMNILGPHTKRQSTAPGRVSEIAALALTFNRALLINGRGGDASIRPCGGTIKSRPPHINTDFFTSNTDGGSTDEKPCMDIHCCRGFFDPGVCNAQNPDVYRQQRPLQGVHPGGVPNAQGPGHSGQWSDRRRPFPGAAAGSTRHGARYRLPAQTGGKG